MRAQERRCKTRRAIGHNRRCAPCVVPRAPRTAEGTLAVAGASPHDLHVAKPALDLETLTVDEKLELIDELWESLGEADIPLTEELRRVLDQRLDSMQREGAVGVAWESVRDELATRTL